MKRLNNLQTAVLKSLNNGARIDEEMRPKHAVFIVDDKTIKISLSLFWFLVSRDYIAKGRTEAFAQHWHITSEGIAAISN